MDDLSRLRAEYARRNQDKRYRGWYSPFDRANIFITQERDRQIAQVLAKNADFDLSSFRVLDLGCGGGSELCKYLGYGIEGRNLFGIDLLWDRVQSAKTRYSGLSFTCGNAARLPYAADTFDLVSQFTVFTSILDSDLRKQMASEMLRVLKPQGMILWYDYRLNPTNRQTRGIETAEIKSLFPGCEYSFRRITLAPPIARVVAPRSWFACEFLNLFAPLRTHYLVAVRK